MFPANFGSTCGMLIRMLAALATLSSASAGAAQGATPSRRSVPVVTEGVDLSTCNTAVITGLSTHSSLRVRSGPSISHPAVGRLYQGQQIFTCNERGEWVGVVYSSVGNCRPKGAVNRSSALPKGCRAGWAHERWINVTSG